MANTNCCYLKGSYGSNVISLKVKITSNKLIDCNNSILMTSNFTSYQSLVKFGLINSSAFFA